VPRGPSTRELLKLDWDYPVYVAAAAAPSEGTAVRAPRQALSREEALRILAGKDLRPLLVLRECAFCNKTDDALLTPGTDNERILFLSRWFHCVKLPVDVTQPDHPFNALFPNDESEHLFVAARDGSDKAPLEADTSRVELWAAMGRTLAAAYVKDPTTAYKEIHSTFDRLDVLDVKLGGLEAKKSDLMETPGVDAAKLKKVDAEIEQVRKEIASAREEVQRLSKLELKAGTAASR
jgi:hypothetical protein